MFIICIRAIIQWLRKTISKPQTWIINFPKNIYISILNDGVERIYDNNNSIYKMDTKEFYIKLNFSSETYLQNVLSIGI